MCLGYCSSARQSLLPSNDTCATLSQSFMTPRRCLAFGDRSAVRKSLGGRCPEWLEFAFTNFPGLTRVWPSSRSHRLRSERAIRGPAGGAADRAQVGPAESDRACPKSRKPHALSSSQRLAHGSAAPSHHRRQVDRRAALEDQWHLTALRELCRGRRADVGPFAPGRPACAAWGSLGRSFSVC